MKLNNNNKKNVLKRLPVFGQAGRGCLLQRVQSKAADRQRDIRDKEGEDEQLDRAIKVKRPELSAHPGLNQPPQRNRLQVSLH